MSNIPQIISIEGNIGVGKSSFIDILKTTINCEIVPEPVNLWINLKDSNDKNILQTFYNDISRWGYTFQNVACITRMMTIEDTIRKVLETSDKKYIFLDRSLGTDKNIFELMLYESGKISELEHKLYNLWINFYKNYVRKDYINKIIYLQSSPSVCLERIKIRNREEEKNIDIEYLDNLHKYHELWLTNKDNVLILDCSKDFIKDIDYQNIMLSKVKKFIEI